MYLQLADIRLPNAREKPWSERVLSPPCGQLLHNDVRKFRLDVAALLRFLQRTNPRSRLILREPAPYCSPNERHPPLNWQDSVDGRAGDFNDDVGRNWLPVLHEVAAEVGAEMVRIWDVFLTYPAVDAMFRSKFTSTSAAYCHTHYHCEVLEKVHIRQNCSLANNSELTLAINSLLVRQLCPELMCSGQSSEEGDAHASLRADADGCVRKLE